MTQIKIDGKTIKYGIIGNPVSHSLSPAMQTIAFQNIGVNAVYLPFPVKSEDLPKLLHSFELTGIKGFNVTVPFKNEIVPYLDHLSPEVSALQSVNTVKNIDGSWHGYSTDGAGFVRSLKEFEIPVKGIKVLLIGAGGSASSIAYSLMKAGVTCLHILNRTPSKAEHLVNMLKQNFPNREYFVNNLDRNIEFDLLVNSTSVGMNEDKSPVDSDIVRLCKSLVDIVYSPTSTRLMQIADSLNIPNYNGLNMLLYQGVEAFEIWTERQAPVKKMKETLFKSFV